MRNNATDRWRAERRTRPFNKDNPDSFLVLDEQPEVTLARLSRWSVESEAGDLKNLISPLLWKQEVEMLRGSIARVCDDRGIGQETFRTLLMLCRATNWPQASAVVKVARHLGVLPPQTRGIKLAPVWVMVRMEFRRKDADHVTSERHVVNIAGLVSPDDDWTALPTDKLYGLKLGCKKLVKPERGKGKQVESIKPVLLGLKTPTEGPGIFWCGQCRPLYKKPDR